MGFKCGIVGLPNVGKSTLFNALTQAKIESSNYPFCTIEPNVGVVPVPDGRLQRLADIVKPGRIVPATMEFVDIAGLVAGASKGEGLGNKFLANIRETDAIVHLVRCFDDSDVVHVAGKIDPAGDMDVINTELILADLETVDKSFVRLQKASKSGDQKAIKMKGLLQRVKHCLDRGEVVRTLDLGDIDLQLLRDLHLLTIKPVLYIANVSEKGFENNKYLDAVKDAAMKEKAAVVPVCASIESEIAELEREYKSEFLADMGLDEPGLNRVIRAGYELLGLQTFFTAGVQEVRAWTISVNDTAPKAAGKIHTDFERGFIRAEVVSYDDYIKHNGEQGARAAGKLRTEGKGYLVKDGDVIHFLFNV